MKNKVSRVLSEIDKELKKDNSYPYLLPIYKNLKIIDNLLINEKYDKEELEKKIRGIIRLVTEDYNFANSKLGKKISKIIDLLNDKLS